MRLWRQINFNISLVTGLSRGQMPPTVAFACWLIVPGRLWYTTEPMAFPPATPTMLIKAMTFVNPATQLPPLSGRRLQCALHAA